MKKFVKDIIHFWIESWTNNRLVFWIEAICTLMGMIACVLLNFSPNDPKIYLILWLYLFSAIGLAYTSYTRKVSFMVFLMGFYATVTTYGLIKLLF